MIKKAVMTYSYNTSTPKMISYIKDLLTEFTNTLLGKDTVVYLVDPKDSSKYFTSRDITYFVKTFVIVINTTYPKMHALKTYVKDIVRICTRLKIPFPWIIPSGAIISKSYLTPKTIKVRPFAFIKSKYSFKTYIKQYDMRKQSNAAMPNLIHSLDASTTALLYDVFNENHNDNNLYTIHDCFAVTADRVECLVDMLKSVYLKMYSDNVYVKDLHEYIISTIKKTLGNHTFTSDNKYIMIDDERVLYPKLDNVIDTNVSINKLLESSNIVITKKKPQPEFKA